MKKFLLSGAILLTMHLHGVSVPSVFIKVDSTDSIYVGKSSFNGLNNDFALVKYTNDGILDANFGNAVLGISILDIQGGNDVIKSIDLDSDENIVVGGFSQISREAYAASLDPNTVDEATATILGSNLNTNNIPSSFALARFLSDGTLDITFNANSAFSTSIPGTVLTTIGEFSQINGIVIDVTQNIFGAGFTRNLDIDSLRSIALAKYLPTGALDTTFNPAGATPGVVITTLNFDIVANGITLDTATGNIIVVGTHNFADIVVARYLPTGALDTTFNPTGSTPGVLITSIAGSTLQGDSVIIDNSGNILVSGISKTTTQTSLTVIRYTATGTLDTTFNPTGTTPGILLLPIAFANVIVSSITIDSTDKIIVTSFSRNLNVSINSTINRTDPFVITRLNTDGSSDATFISTGISTAFTAPPVTNPDNAINATTLNTTPDTFNDTSNSVILDNSENILVGGFTNIGAPNNDIILARFLDTGLLDTSFNQVGEIRPGILLTNTFTNNSLNTINAAAARDKVEVGAETVPKQPEKKIEKKEVVDVVVETEVKKEAEVALTSPQIMGPKNNVVLESSKIIVSGKSEPHHTVIIYLNGNFSGKATVDADGSWSKSIDFPSDGRFSLTAMVTDETSKSSPQSPPINIEIKNSATRIPQIFSPTHKGVIRGSKNLVISGRSRQNGSVLVYLNNKRVAQVLPDKNGNWIFEYKKKLKTGNYNTHAVFIDERSKRSEPSPKTHFVLA